MAEFVTATEPSGLPFKEHFGGGWTCQEVLQDQQKDKATSGGADLQPEEPSCLGPLTLS